MGSRPRWAVRTDVILIVIRETLEQVVCPLNAKLCFRSFGKTNIQPTTFSPSGLGPGGVVSCGYCLGMFHCRPRSAGKVGAGLRELATVNYRGWSPRASTSQSALVYTVQVH